MNETEYFLFLICIFILQNIISYYAILLINLLFNIKLCKHTYFIIHYNKNCIKVKSEFSV